MLFLFSSLGPWQAWARGTVSVIGGSCVYCQRGCAPRTGPRLPLVLCLLLGSCPPWKVLLPCTVLQGKLGENMGKCPALLPRMPLETLSARGGGRRIVAIIKTASTYYRKQPMQPLFQADFPPPPLPDATLGSDHRVSWAEAVQPPVPKDKTQNTNSSKEQNPLTTLQPGGMLEMKPGSTSLLLSF